MSWVRHIDCVKFRKKKDQYFEEYEIATECRITGGLDYEKGLISCSFLTFEKDENGLYKYLLRIKSATHGEQNDSRYLDVHKSGYYFKEGVAEEFISLFSLYFQCRFYIVATSTIFSNGQKHRSERYLKYRRTEGGIHPTIFSDKTRSFSVGLVEFLDKIRSLPTEFHQDFLWASFQYLQSLRQVSLDTEMVFIRLVSAVEILSKYIDMDSSVDIFSAREIHEIVDVTSLSKEQQDKLKEIFSVRNSKLRFVSFIKKYCTRFFKGGKSRAEHCKIRKDALVPTLKTIYSARSAYLHSGESMYLSMPLRMKEARTWDTDPSMGMTIDNRSFSGSQKLPFAHFFESLVRHCLLNFLKDKQPQ